MKLEIWSDVMCPFCYIGKRRIEQALDRFEYADEITIEWRSFQLNPNLQTDPSININEYLAESKGWPQERAQKMNQQVTEMALKVGLEFDMDKAVVANSFDAHRIIQFAKDQGKGADVEELLFKAYFTEGKNIADHKTLIALASECGLDSDNAKEVLEGDRYANQVKHDIEVASSMNIRGVPFFLFDRKYAISGARETNVFLKALKQSWNKWIQDDEGVPTIN